jgi:hypothetical protein
MADVQRDERGRFIKGSASPSPGRPKRSVEVSFHDILVESVTEDIWRGIVRKALHDALLGDKYARQFIADYTIGRAPQILELRAADASLLAELLRRFEARGQSAGDVFNAMLAVIADEVEVEDDARLNFLPTVPDEK